MVDNHITPLAVVGCSMPIKPLVRKTTVAAGSSTPIQPLVRKKIAAKSAPENPFRPPRSATAEDNVDSLVELDSDVSEFEVPDFNDSWTNGCPNDGDNFQTQPMPDFGMSFADLAVRPRDLDKLGMSFADLAARPGSGMALPGSKATFDLESKHSDWHPKR